MIRRIPTAAWHLLRDVAKAFLCSPDVLDEPIDLVPTEPTPTYDAVWNDTVRLNANQRVEDMADEDFGEWCRENGWIER